MSRFCLLWVGKPARKGAADQLAQDYRRRIERDLRFEERALKPAATASGDVTTAIRREGQRILDALSAGDEVVLLDERGATMTSREFAAFVQQRRTRAARRVVWVIGGSQGVSEEVTRRSDFVISLSRMTLPHALARVLLLEQLFRALCIQSGHPYHH